MASIYESPGQQVALTGSQTSPSFQPVLAYDPSRMMLAQSERDLQAFAEFSKTLSDFIVDKQKEKNKEAFLRGLTGLGNKEVSLDPKFVQDQKVKTELLRQGAEEEINVANSIAKTDPLQAERYYNRARAVNGWEAYGQAVREAKILAAQSRGFFSNFLSSSDATRAIQIPGTNRTILPSQATTEEELAAIDAAAGAEFMTKFQGFNPALVAEYVIPVIEENRSEALAARTREMLQNNKEIKLNKLDVDINNGVDTFTKQEDIQSNVLGWFSSAYNITRNWREANEFVRGSLVDRLKRLATIQDERSYETILDYYERSNISEDKSLGTLGQRFEAEFDALRNYSKAINKEVETEREEQINNTFQEILASVDLAQQAGTSAESERSWNAARTEILKLSSQYPVKAAAALAQLDSKPKGYSKKEEEVIIATIKDPDELLALKLTNRLSDEGYKLALENVPSSGGKAKIAAVGKDYINLFAAQLAEDLKTQGINDPENARIMALPFARQLVNELMVELNREEAGLRSQGKTLTEAEIRDRFSDRGNEKLQNNSRFKVEVKDGKLVTKLSAAETTTLESGKTVQQLVNIATSKLPRVTSAFNPSLSREALVNNIQAIGSGGKPDERVNVLAAAANTTPSKFLEAQATLPENRGVDISGLKSSNAAKLFQENYALDPSAALGLANPRSNAMQRQRYRQRIENARARQVMDQQQGPALELLRSKLIEKEGGAQRYNAANKGGSADTPEGISNLESLTFAQVKKLQQQGYNAVGAYQFTPNTLKIVQAAAGIPDSAKFDKANQDRMFEAVLFQGANNRKRLADYVNGRSTDIRGAVEDFSNEFAAVFNPSGGSRYTGIAGNRPSLDVTQMLRKLREERMGRGTPVNMSASNIVSINIERPGRGDSFQPGFDLYFQDKRFGAVLPGIVKEIRRNNGNYGNMIVVESTDPSTGNTVDVVYAHLNSISVARGQRISPGQFIGIQGNTGNVINADSIASVDFLAPAPAGSNSMTPYRNWQELVKMLETQIRSGSIR